MSDSKKDNYDEIFGFNGIEEGSDEGSFGMPQGSDDPLEKKADQGTQETSQFNPFGTPLEEPKVAEPAPATPVAPTPVEKKTGFDTKPTESIPPKGMPSPFGGELKNSRIAKRKMTKEEYRKRLEELNENAETKNYVFIFGAPGSGKSYIIASLLHYMNSYSNGTVHLNMGNASKEEVQLYNQMIEMFDDPDKALNRTSIDKFYELNLIFTPQSTSSKIELTFLDASGEGYSEIYWGHADSARDYEGALPDYIEVILESNVRSLFVFVYDHSAEDDPDSPQVSILKAFYDKLLRIQEYRNKRYPKILLISKADKLTEKTFQKYEHSPMKYAQADGNKLKAFANGFFKERGSVNRAIFYRMGTFTKYNELDKFDADCPSRLFNWIYGYITGGRQILVKKSWWQRFKEWLLGS